MAHTSKEAGDAERAPNLSESDDQVSQPIDCTNKPAATPDQVSYAEIAALAKRTGRTINTCIALNDDSDPCLADRPGVRLDSARWFAALWHKLPQNGVHIRRLHYILVSLGDIALPNGEPYENTHRCWKIICKAAGDARYLRLVPTTALLTGAPVML
jgi:hypothetical protein